MKVAIIGAGWAGLAAAVEATRRGIDVTLLEAGATLGGRARRVVHEGVALDNGQHILIGAYRDTLALLREVGIDPEAALRRRRLSLRFADGSGLAAARWLPPPFDLLAGIASARGWSLADKAALLRSTLRWRRAGFSCAAQASVADLCAGLTPRARDELIEPLCVSALNTPIETASGAVFLRVLRDALFGARGGADLLLPRCDLGALMPDAAARWLQARGAQLRLGARARVLAAGPSGWQVDDESFDAVLLACPAWDALRLLQPLAETAGPDTRAIANWCGLAAALRHDGIATVYARGAGVALPAPMLALRSRRDAPAQFVFDRGQLGGPAGLLAFVVSTTQTARAVLEPQVLAQAVDQLGLHGLHPVLTVLEKRATFACTPGLARPPMKIAPGLLACADYVQGPYPATLEGAVRNGTAAAARVR